LAHRSFFTNSAETGKEGKGQTMNVFRKLLDEEHGQGLVEYTLIVFLVAFVFWVAMKDTAVGTALTDNWTRITDCVSTPFSCGSAS
jgi:Flp pilus assembly pilin Flp